MVKLKHIWRRTKQYVKYDLREIIAPSSLPDPPGYVPPPKVPFWKWFQITGQAFREYVDTWDSEKLRQKLKERHGEDPFDKEMEATKQELKGLAEEFGEAARGGAVAMKPFLQNLWNTRAVAYRDAVQQFIVGYKEGFQEANKPDIPPDIAQEMQQQRPREAAADTQPQNPAAPDVQTEQPRAAQQQQQGRPPPQGGT